MMILKDAFLIFVVAEVARKAEGLRCVICLSDLDPKCIYDPPEPVKCERDATHCMIVREFFQNGTMASLTRTCSPLGLGNVEECEDGTTSDGRPARVCHRTCRKDGCNRTAKQDISSCLSVVMLLLVVRQCFLGS